MEKEEEKQFYLFLVAFGGHKATIDILKEYFRYESGEGISQFFYLEYFLQEPLKINDSFNKDDASVFCPFLERMIKEQPFLPDWEDLESKIDDSIKKLIRKNIDLLPRTRLLERNFLKKPLKINTASGFLRFGETLFAEWKKDGQVKNVKLDKHFQSYRLDYFNKELNEILCAKKIKSEDKIALIKERVVLIYPWAKNGALKSEAIDIIIVPIASNKLFYGYILIGFFQKKKPMADIANIRTNLKYIIEEQVKKFYLPALILCHHSYYEKSCCEGDRINIDNKIPFLFSEHSENMLENNVHKLWSLRVQKTSELATLVGHKLEAFKDSHFIFKDHFWGSPTTIQKIEEAFTWDMNFGEGNENDKSKLKTFLIAGGPGSGKDTLSKMIGLFSSGHTFCKPNIFNMASLKPNWIAPFSLAGMNVKFQDAEYLLDGIFKKVLEETRENPAMGNSDPIIIFDELNSLDVDSQGTLLRILENSEVVPIGGIDEGISTEKVKKLLVIGVVNELPPELTMEDTIKSLSKDRKLWGNLLGAFLYESYRSMRRLRDDLFYRFRRGGYIELPDLDNRREDIPIIFFTSLPKDLKNKIKFIEYDVWDLLTNERIEWKGNVRQLQAVVHNIARETKKEFSTNPNKNELDVRMVRRVLEKMKLLQKKESDDASTTYKLMVLSQAASRKKKGKGDGSIFNFTKTK